MTDEAAPLSSEAGHPIRVGGCGRRGSSSNQKDSHAGFGLVYFGNASTSCFLETTIDLTAAPDVELEVLVQSCV